jgi:hypothetical protein
MSVILMNEFVGDAILDAVIPGIYAAILVAGADLFAVSVLALVLPFCFVVGVLCYLIFVYRPARNACNRRREQLKRVASHEPISKSKKFQQRGSKKHLQRSTFRVRTPSGYFRRVLVIIKHALQDGIAWLSCGEFRLRDPRKHQIQRDWCNLNMPARSQGIILEEPPATANMTRQPSLSRMLAEASCNSMFLPPVKISDMMTTATKWKELYVKHQKGLTGTKVGDSLDEANQLVVTRPVPASDSIRKITPLISFDPNDIISRIRVQLTPSGPSQRDDLDSVRTDLLFREFQKILEVFYPDGIALTAHEKVEACELFNDWKEDHCPPKGLGLIGEDEAKASFQLFQRWFLGDFMCVFHRNMQERLIEHTLNCVPNMKKRPQKGTSSSMTNPAADEVVRVKDVIPPTSRASPSKGRRLSTNILSFGDIYNATEDVEVLSRTVSLKSASSADLLLCGSKVRVS